MSHPHLPIDEIAATVRSIWPDNPAFGVVLGSGLGTLADSITAEATIDFDCLPHFPRATALGHRGRFVCGRVQGVPVIVQQGRFHAYEGHSFEHITLPIRVMQSLGVRTLILTNAAGGLRPGMQVGDVMLIEDHINLLFGRSLPVHGSAIGEPRPADGSPHYDRQLMSQAEQTGRQLSERVTRGVYLALSGPCYETRAEYRMVRNLGADAVGMSTVPEVLIARLAGMRVLAMSVISNVETSDIGDPVSGEEVIRTVSSVEPVVRSIVHAIVSVSGVLSTHPGH